MKFEKRKVQIALAELTRERNIREKYYPHAIAERKLTENEAQRRLEALNYAIEILSAILSSMDEQGKQLAKQPSLLGGERQ
jgi:hypothetical protein